VRGCPSVFFFGIGEREDVAFFRQGDVGGIGKGGDAVTFQKEPVLPFGVKLFAKLFV
jgi:hypothetical protein